MKSHLALLFVLAVTSCATAPPRSTEVHHGTLTYPKTVLALPSGGTLTHVAERPSPNEWQIPFKERLQRIKVVSRYELKAPSGKVLTMAPSILYDPKYAEGGLVDPPYTFSQYFRNTDQLDVHCSPTGKTVVIEETRSGGETESIFIILREAADGSWSWSQFFLNLIECYDMRSMGPNALFYPFVTGVSDERVWFQSPKNPGGFKPDYKERKWSKPVDMAKNGQAKILRHNPPSVILNHEQ